MVRKGCFEKVFESLSEQVRHIATKRVSYMLGIDVSQSELVNVVFERDKLIELWDVLFNVLCETGGITSVLQSWVKFGVVISVNECDGWVCFETHLCELLPLENGSLVLAVKLTGDGGCSFALVGDNGILDFTVSESLRDALLKFHVKRVRENAKR